ncbi:TRAP transporter large permease [Boseongicola aestuarii]|uniref:TRAP transporter large permease protein n=1 Tax=Boseongicola aestuarii TaxID=1470561 RepID=A0A238IZ68_9RHOB|nr:TRAP transporter large permease subunit [Boseongicola aestuarii]SMX23696.1 Sialic acid TRAP transporter permease protein SiaT [Boseongicola aestuarii]
MESLFVAFVILLLVMFFLGLGVWVFAGLLLVSTVGLVFLIDMPPDRIGKIMSPLVIRSATSWEISAIPMFIWMGEIMLRTDMSDRLFRGLSPLTYHLPGRLLHTNIMGSALFAAISGSSAATTATVGKITLAELEKRNYSKMLAFGSLAGAGSLGLLIPPSIVMIVYGVLAEVSISRLFAAGVIPGLMIASLYAGYVMIVSLMYPDVAPPDREKPGLKEMGKGLLDLIPISVLIFIVLGSIYSGIATPSEAAAVGVVATLTMTVLTGQMNRDVFFGTLVSSVQTSCMIAAILIAAAFLSTAMGFLHVPQDVANAIGSLDLSPYQLIFILAIFYVLLGMFLEGISITVMSLPITLPLILGAGFDPIWFGIFLVIMVELAQITPPVGFNLFIIQGLTGTPIMRVALAALPFFILMCVGVVILTLFPDIALWLPNLLFNS